MRKHQNYYRGRGSKNFNILVDKGHHQTVISGQYDFRTLKKSLKNSNIVPEPKENKKSQVFSKSDQWKRSGHHDNTSKQTDGTCFKWHFRDGCAKLRS